MFLGFIYFLNLHIISSTCSLPIGTYISKLQNKSLGNWLFLPFVIHNLITQSKTQKPIERSGNQQRKMKDLIEKTKKTKSRGTRRDHDEKIVLQSSQETMEKKRRDQDTKREALDWQIWELVKEERVEEGREEMAEHRARERQSIKF